MKNVFLIEDDQDDQDIFAMALNEIDGDIVCHFAEDGVEAVEKLKKDPTFIPDMIFIDMNMPKMNGLRCIHEIRNLSRLDGIPIYIYSTNTDPYVMEESKKLGASFLLKPTRIGTLIRNLASLMRSKGTTDAE